MANDKKYKPEKDGKATGVLADVDAIVAEDYLPLPLQITRLANIRYKVQAKILGLKAGL